MLDDRATLILGVAVMCGASTMILPDDVVSAAPQFVQFFLSSGIAVGGTAAILLQLLLPKTVSLTGTAPKAASASTAASASSVSNKERVQQVVNA